MAGLLVLIILLRLATPFVAALFAYLALRCLTLPKRAGKWLAVVIFLVLLSGAAYGLGYFIHQTIHALPEIADKAIPSIIARVRSARLVDGDRPKKTPRAKGSSWGVRSPER